MKKLVAIAAALGFAISANAALIVNGGFEDPALADGVNFQTFNAGSTAINGWDIISGSVDLIREYWTPAEPRQSLDLAGNGPGAIQQSISGLVPNQKYALTFALSGNPDGGALIKTVQVTFYGPSQTATFSTAVNTRSSMGWVYTTLYFTPDSTTGAVRFQDITGDGSAYGPALDDISLTAVPEPTTVIAGALLLLPLGLSTVRRLRK